MTTYWCRPERIAPIQKEKNNTELEKKKSILYRNLLFLEDDYFWKQERAITPLRAFKSLTPFMI